MIGLAIGVAVILYRVFVYNGLVKARQMAEEAWSGIDVQLKRRADLIPEPDRDGEGLRRPREVVRWRRSLTLRNRAQAVPAGDVAAQGRERKARFSARRSAASWRSPKPIRT